MTQPIIPLTPKVSKYKKLLCGTAIGQAVMAIMIMFFNPYDAINQLMSAMILACAAQNLHFCYVMFYIILSVFSVVTYYAFVGLAIQN